MRYQADLRIAEPGSAAACLPLAGTQSCLRSSGSAGARVAVDRARAVARAYGLPGTAPGAQNGGIHPDGALTLDACTEDSGVRGGRGASSRARTLFRLVDRSTVWIDAEVAGWERVSHLSGGDATVVFNGRRSDARVYGRRTTAPPMRPATHRVRLGFATGMTCCMGATSSKSCCAPASSGDARSDRNTLSVPHRSPAVAVAGRLHRLRRDADGGLDVGAGADRRGRRGRRTIWTASRATRW